MRAWILWGAATLLTTAACGGDDVSVDVDGGGTDTGVATDTGVTSDTGTGDDSGNTDDSGVADSGNTDSGNTGDAGSWDPSQLSGLVLWLDAAKGVTQNNNNVSAWADQTSHKNDASGGQGNQSHQPTVVAKGINGLPVIRFTPPQNYQQHQYLTIADNNDKSLQWGTGDFAVALVGSYTNPATGQGAGSTYFYFRATYNSQTTLGLFGNTTGGGAVAAVGGTVGNVTVTSASTTNNDGKPHRWAIRRNGTALEVWVDGAKDTSNNAAADVTLANAIVFIGSRGFQGGYLQGDIAEELAVKGTLSDNDMTAIDTYLKTKYGL